MKGRLIIISAPSGAGKTTIVKHLLGSGLDLEFSISATTRIKRGNETDGKDYYFLSAEEFRNMIKKGGFAEWEEVYPDHFYGTLKSEIERIRDKGKHVLFDVDVKGGITLKKIFGNDAISLFIMPPSIGELEKRLVNRGTDNSNKITMRVTKAAEEMKLADKFDHIIINDNLENAQMEAYQLVMEFIKSQVS